MRSASSVRRRRLRWRRSLPLWTVLAILLLVPYARPARAATVPSGFTESIVASGLSSPTAMAFAPDGRLFVCEQGGRLRVIKNGVLLPTPFATLTVHPLGERGLLGVAFDPDFTTNQYVYVYYTATTPTYHNRISRLTANGDVAAAGSEVVLLDLDPLTGASNHNGGALHFGPDGKLYVAVGDNADGSNAQSVGNLHGKILRLDTDGSIPADNPFYGVATGKNRAIWALGLRNPFTFSIDRVTGTMFINDVGEGGWEEINEGAAGANYGWPETEGYTADPRFHSPRYAYAHTGGACAVAGAAFYDAASLFPADHAGDYFFADYCAGWIRRLDANGGWTAAAFASGIASPVDLKISSDGSLYYLARGNGSSTGVVYRVRYGADGGPTITTHPASQTIPVDSPVLFSVRASGSAPLSYQWQRNGSDVPGATEADYAIASVVASDDGARFRAIVTNEAGTAVSNEAVLTVTSNERPTATITHPAAGAPYSGGEEIWCAATGTDPEDGTLPADAFTWQVDFHHDTHSHPFIPPTTGVTSGWMTIPTTGETSSNVWYRVTLTVVDSRGLTHTTHRDIIPRKSRITLDTNPTGLQLKLDGQPVTTPLTFDGVVGIIRSIDAAPQTAGGITWTFRSWSDGGAPRHDISTPSTDTAYVASFSAASADSGPVAYWDMDAGSVSGSTLLDRSGNGNHGTITGTAVEAGRLGESLAFDGEDDRVVIPGAPSLNTAAGFTVAFWYLAVENTGSIIAKPRSASWTNSWQFGFDGPGLFFASSDGSGQQLDGRTAPEPGSWTHLAGTWDGTTKRFFINGTEVAAANRLIAMDDGPVVIGGDYNDGVFVLPFRGRVDDVRVYGHALSDSQIQTLYGSDPSGGLAPPPDPETVFDAHFDSGDDGFAYADDAFRGTGQATYASGSRRSSEGYSGGGLRIMLGGIDDTVVDGMSGGWTRAFSLATPGTAILSFRYKLTQGANYEVDEVSEVLVTVDELQHGGGGTDYVARIAGDGNGGEIASTGWQSFEIPIGPLAAGSHTLTIGGYNNRKTFNDETTEILLDDVKLRVR